MKYIIDHTKLKMGDVIVIKRYDRLSMRMRDSAKSDFSHVMLYVGGCSALESEGNGVSSMNVQRLLVDSKDDLVIKRYPQLTLEQFEEINTYARKNVGMEYSMREMIDVNIRKEVGNPQRQFCSRYVARAFAAAGIEIVDDADFCYPDEIVNSGTLLTVKDVLREASTAEEEYASSQSILTLQTDSVAELLEQLRNKTGIDIQSLEQVLDYVQKNPGDDETVSDILTSSPYFSLWKMHHDSHPEEFDIDLFVKKYQPHHVEAAMQMLETIEPSLKLHFMQCIALNEEFKKTPLKTVALFKDLYDHIVEEHMLRLITLKSVINIK